MNLEKYRVLAMSLDRKPSLKDNISADEIEEAANAIQTLTNLVELSEYQAKINLDAFNVVLEYSVSLLSDVKMWKDRYYAIEDEYDKLKLAYDQLSL